LFYQVTNSVQYSVQYCLSLKSENDVNFLHACQRKNENVGCVVSWTLGLGLEDCYLVNITDRPTHRRQHKLWNDM